MFLVYAFVCAFLTLFDVAFLQYFKMNYCLNATTFFQILVLMFSVSCLANDVGDDSGTKRK